MGCDWLRGGGLRGHYVHHRTHCKTAHGHFLQDTLLAPSQHHLPTQTTRSKEVDGERARQLGSGGAQPSSSRAPAARRPLSITPQREGAGRRRDEEQQGGGSRAHGWSGAGGGEDGRQRQRAGKKNSNTPDKVTQPQLLPGDRSNTAKAV